MYGRSRLKLSGNTGVKMGKLKIGQLIILLASACGMYGQDFDKMVKGLLDGSVPLIKADSLQLLQSKSPEILVLDAREEEEYSVSHIENAIWVGYKNFDLDKVNASKDQEIVVYCSVGYRSEKIGEKLKEAGYQNVRNLYGGIFEWKNKGYVVVDQKENQTEKVHAYSKSWGRWLINADKVYE